MQMMFICLCVHKQASARTSTCPSCKTFAVPCTAFLMNRRVGNTSKNNRKVPQIASSLAKTRDLIQMTAQMLAIE